MKRTVVAVAACCIALPGCGDDPLPESRPATALPASICSPISYGGPGRPQLVIANSSAYQGPYKGHGVQTAQAMKMVLAERGWRAGEYTVGMQACDETSAKTGVPDPARCSRNARAFAGNPSVVGVVGPLTSNCAAHMLATLNDAPGGPLATISGGNTYVGLTRSGPGTAPDEPHKHVPTGRRGYARLTPTDDVQGAAAAVLLRREGVRRAFVVDHDDLYGVGLAAAFRSAAERIGVEVVDTARWDERARSYRDIAARIRSARAKAVFIAGDFASNGARLVRDLTAGAGEGVHFVAGDSFNLAAELVEAAGAGAEGFRITIAVVPNRNLPPAGRAFAAAFEKRYHQRPCCFSVHDAQATHMLLDAIAKSGGDRARVAAQVMRSRVTGGLIGDFEIDSNGDTTLNTIGVYRIRGGRSRFETAITPDAEVLGRE